MAAIKKVTLTRTDNEWELAVSDRQSKHWPHRVFLSDDEWKVFDTWGVPVRYVWGEWRDRLGDRCKFKSCGKPADQAAHKIPYKKGILKYHLTPSYLMRWENLVAACIDHNEDLRWSEARIRKHVAQLRGRKPHTD